MDEDNRRAPRRRTLKGATIVFAEGSFTVKCLVKNLSDTGALLEMESTAEVPNQFRLVFEDRSADRRCDVAWRSVKRLGVRFVG
jgi:hypothetical protein